MEQPLQPVVGQWLAKIKLAREFKARRFQPDADDGIKFFCGPYDFLYGPARRTDRHFRQAFDGEEDNEIPAPRFQMTVNKVAEMVQIFGPVLYNRNPVRQVTPRKHPPVPNALMQTAQADPQTFMQMQMLDAQAAGLREVDAARAGLLEHYLNFTPNAMDLKTEARWAIDEAIIKGAGLLWTEAYTPPGGGGKMAGSFFDSIDNLVIDPDMTSLRFSKWIARRRIKPVWEVERLYQLPPGSIRGNMESLNRQGEVNSDPEGSYFRATGQTNDLLTYWEVYSKNGIGGRLTGVADWVKAPLEQFGDFTFLVIAEGIPYPLNVPDAMWDMPEGQAMQAIAERVQWPVPFWADDSWPFTMISFHEVPNDPWPMSHLAPAMGELKFLNWVYSYIAGKIRVSSRDFIAILESASEELKTAIQSGSDYEIIRIKATHGKTINEIVQFLQHPQFNGDLWRVIEYVSEQFDRRTGLTELAYGISSRQYRSAAEADAKRDATSVRPDDMANKVEDAMSLVARQEALTARWLLTGQDVNAVMGPVGSALWDKLIVPSDPAEILYQLEYRIESGSARKPNKDRDRDNMQQAMTTLLPFFQNVAMQTGMVEPFNALIVNWAKTIDLDPAGMLLPQPPPPQPTPQGGQPQGQGPPAQQQGPPR